MSSTAVLENSFYVGNFLSAILLGVIYVIYFLSVKILFSDLRKTVPGRRSYFFLSYITLLMVLVTIGTAANAFLGEAMWIIHRNTPGGPPAYFAESVNIWYQIMGTAASTLQAIAGDGLLIYRCFILWSSSYAVILLPFVIFIGTIVLAIMTLIAAASPDGNFFVGIAQHLGIAYYALSISLNIMVTTLICMRLFRASRGISAVLGQNNAKLYTSLTAILSESAALYSITGIMFIIPYARSSQLTIVFGVIYGDITVIAPMLIIYRIITKQSWGSETVKLAMSSAAFAPATSDSTTTHEMQSTATGVYGIEPTEVHLKKHDHSCEEIVSGSGSSVGSAGRIAFGPPSVFLGEKNKEDVV